MLINLIENKLYVLNQNLIKLKLVSYYLAVWVLPSMFESDINLWTE